MSKLVPALIIMGSALALFIFVLPNYDSIRELQEAIVVRKEILSDRESLIKKIGDLNRTFQSNLVNVAKISSALPKDKKLAELTSSINTISAQSGADLVSAKYSVSGRKKEKEFDVVFVELRLSGTYQSFTKFLELTEQNIRISDVKSVNISPEGKDANLLKIGVNFDAYFLGEK